MEYEIDEIEEIEYLGEIEDYYYDVGMEDSPHTFFANDILVHNSLYVNSGKILDSINYPHKDNIEVASKFLDEKISGIIEKVIDSSEQKLANVMMNCPDCKISFKREMIARRAIFVTKKRYAAWVIYDESGKVKPGSSHEIEVKGLESVRSTTPDFIRPKFVKFYEVLLKTKNQSDVNKFIKDVYNSMINAEPELIAKTCSANKLSEYTDPVTGNPIKGSPMQVKGAINYNKLIKRANVEDDYEMIFEGDKVRTVYIKSSEAFPDFSENSIAFKTKLPREFKIITDNHKTIEVVFIKPISTFYDIMNWQLPSFDTEDIEDLFV